jgi:hypothetical protein
MILKGEYDTIDPDGLARSDNYYGWAKIACEWCLFCFHMLETTNIK